MSLEYFIVSESKVLKRKKINDAGMSMGYMCQPKVFSMAKSETI